ncbi:hypothetical protein EG327_004386 [Venturia inaequalis]|uniref:Rhodopsin domain-containing protein n=1 Tax=Venturia inaequalis TaxID=5025 RepID=A0A8H3VC91_VENIN|nr:hypothetical protein EG327_004386 [Venturia inaequalis]
MVMKVSVGAFLLRICTKRTHVWIIRSIMLYTVLFGGAYFFLATFQCRPISAWWKLTSGHRSCVGPAIVLGTSYTSAALNSVADWTFGILPYFIVRDLDLPRKQKVLIAIILGFAAIGSLATLIRMPFIVNLTNTDDFLYATVDIAVWSIVEPGVGIAATCAATLRPLLQPLVRGRPGWCTKTSGHSKSPPCSCSGPDKPQVSRSHVFSQPHSMPTLRPDYVGHYSKITSSAEQSFGPADRDNKEPPRSTQPVKYGMTSSKDDYAPKSTTTATTKEVTSDGARSTDDIQALPIWNDSHKHSRMPSKPTKIYASQDQRRFLGLSNGHKGLGFDGASLESMGITKSIEVTFSEEIELDDADGLGKSLEDGIWEQENGKSNATSSLSLNTRDMVGQGYTWSTSVD